jgi:hypothetical protein
VKWRATSWLLIKDIALTGTGLAVIYVELLSPRAPNGLLLGTGLALTVPSIADHVKALLPSSGGGGSSPPSLPGGQPPSARSSGGTDG